MRKILATLAAAALLVMAVAVPATAITKDFVQDFEHTFVGLIVFYDAKGEFSHRCTGELLAPTVVLTAGHCTDNEAGGVMASARIWFQQGAGANYDPATQHDPVTGYPDECAAGTLGTLCAESLLMYNYGFDHFAGFPNTHDVGIVILTQAMTGPGKATLAGPETLDTLRKARGTQEVDFLVSGYGISYSSKRGNISFRERLMANSKLVNLNAPWNDGYNVQLNGNGNNRGGTCSGDSGGPLFWPPDTNQIVGVTSFGKVNAGCRGDDYYYRTDRSDVIAWILARAGTAAGLIDIGD
jgi:hypothetical protein